MNLTTDRLPLELLDAVDARPVISSHGQEDRRGVSQIAVTFASLSIIIIIILVVILAVFLRGCRKNRKIYVPMTYSVSRIQGGTEGHGKVVDAEHSHNYLPNIFESLVAVEKETDDEDEADELDSPGRCRGANSGLEMDCDSPRRHASSRCSEPKHSRSLPSLKHLSAHEEALSYLALSHLQNTSAPQQAKSPTTSGIFGSFLSNDNNFIRSRSFNERIAFGLNISRHSLTNRNRINVNALNRCMTTVESGSKSKSKTKESIKSRKQRNVRSSFIKSMRISSLVECMPSSFNIKKRFSSSARRCRKSGEGSRMSPGETTAVTKSLSFCSKAHSTNVDVTVPEGLVIVCREGSPTFSNFKLSPSTPLSFDVENLFGEFPRQNFSQELIGEQRTDNIWRSKSCMALFNSFTSSKSDYNLLKGFTAISFDQLEEYSKRYIG